MVCGEELNPFLVTVRLLYVPFSFVVTLLTRNLIGHSFEPASPCELGNR